VENPLREVDQCPSKSLHRSLDTTDAFYADVEGCDGDEGASVGRIVRKNTNTNSGQTTQHVQAGKQHHSNIEVQEVWRFGGGNTSHCAHPKQCAGPWREQRERPRIHLYVATSASLETGCLSQPYGSNLDLESDHPSASCVAQHPATAAKTETRGYVEQRV
jgi:hypothetical protein